MFHDIHVNKFHDGHFHSPPVQKETCHMYMPLQLKERKTTTNVLECYNYASRTKRVSWIRIRKDYCINVGTANKLRTMSRHVFVRPTHIHVPREAVYAWKSTASGTVSLHAQARSHALVREKQLALVCCMHWSRYFHLEFCEKYESKGRGKWGER